MRKQQLVLLLMKWMRNVLTVLPSSWRVQAARGSWTRAACCVSWDAVLPRAVEILASVKVPRTVPTTSRKDPTGAVSGAAAPTPTPPPRLSQGLHSYPLNVFFSFFLHSTLQVVLTKQDKFVHLTLACVSLTHRTSAACRP